MIEIDIELPDDVIAYLRKHRDPGEVIAAAVYPRMSHDLFFGNVYAKPDATAEQLAKSRTRADTQLQRVREASRNRVMQRELARRYRQMADEIDTMWPPLP